MKLLLDENLPVKLKEFFSNTHAVSTVREQDWSGKKNGELLQLIADNGFEALVTIDKNLSHQQNLDKFDIKVIILHAVNNKLSTLEPFIRTLETKLSSPIKEKIIEVTLTNL